MKSPLRNLLNGAFCFVAAIALSACGGSGSSTSTARAGTANAIVLLSSSTSPDLAGVSAARLVGLRDSGGHGGGHGGGPVELSEILSLTVTITKVYLHYCDDDDDHGSGVPDVILVKEDEFDPSSLKVHAGDTVRWKWTSDTPHTITSGVAGDPDAGTLFDQSGSVTGDVVELIFAESGHYPYFSDNDTDVEAGMAGVIRVEDEDDDEHGHHDRIARSNSGHGGGGDDDGEDGEDGEESEGGDDGEDGDDDGDGDGEHGSSRGPLLFDGAFDVNLLDLTALSQVLTSGPIPAGEFCRIELFIENPRLVLADDPETEITNVHLTANGRMFIKDHFEIVEGEDVIIVLNFGGIHLVRAGNSGKYVLTPQLRVDVQVTGANVLVSGEIVSVDEGTRTIQVQTDGDLVQVAVADGATITTDDDADEADGSTTEVALTFADLAAGQIVEIQGLLNVSGDVDATAVTVADESFDSTV